MEFSYNELRCKEVVNVLCGRRMGRISDIIISSNKCVLGFVVPGERKLFRNNEDIFVPWNCINKIGEDCILISLELDNCTAAIRQNKVDKQCFDIDDDDYIVD